MKILQICVPAGILFTLSLLLLAVNSRSAIEYHYERCLQNIMVDYEIDSEEVALSRFEDLATAKAKILEADRLLDQVNRMNEGPVAPRYKHTSLEQKNYARQLQTEARQLLNQLEQRGLVSN